MKLETEGLNIETNIANKKSFIIETNAAAFEILSKNLYQNVPRAIIRELCTNAIDANRQLKQPLGNFEVTLPNFASSTFSIEDFGVGMTYNEVMEIYTSFFSSTKSNSNEQTGMFGLGSKTPFAYTTQFTIETTKNGEKNVFNAFKDEKGIPCVAPIARVPVDKNLHGTKISFSVKISDVNSFYHEFLYCLATFPELPKIKNGNDFYEFIESSYGLNPGLAYLDISKMNTLYKKDFFNLSECEINLTKYISQKVFLEMGSVLYNVDVHSIKQLTNKQIGDLIFDIISNTSKDGIMILHANIGDVSITPSREELQYDNKTLDFICSKVIEVFCTSITYADCIEKTFGLERAGRLNLFNRINEDSFSKYITPDTAIAIQTTKDNIAKKVETIKDIATAIPVGSFFATCSYDNIAGREKMPPFDVKHVLAISDATKIAEHKEAFLDTFLYKIFIHYSDDCQPFVLSLSSDYAAKSKIQNNKQHSGVLKWRNMSFIKKYCIDNDIARENGVNILYIIDDDKAAAKIATQFKFKLLTMQDFLNVENLYKKAPANKKPRVTVNSADEIPFTAHFYGDSLRQYVDANLGKLSSYRTELPFKDIKAIATKNKAKIFLILRKGAKWLIPTDVNDFLDPKSNVKNLSFDIIDEHILWTIDNSFTSCHFDPLIDEYKKFNYIFVSDTSVSKFKKLNMKKLTSCFDWVTFFPKMYLKHFNNVLTTYHVDSKDLIKETFPNCLKKNNIDALIAHRVLDTSNCVAYDIIKNTHDEATSDKIVATLKNRRCYAYGAAFINSLNKYLTPALQAEFDKLCTYDFGSSNVNLVKDGPNTDALLKRYPMLTFIKRIQSATYSDYFSAEENKKIVDYICEIDNL